MANQAEKKAAERVKKFRKEHGTSLLIILALYAIIRIGIYYSTWTTMHTIFFVGCAITEYWCYGILCGHLESGQMLDGAGGFVEPCRDILYVIEFSQVISLVFGDSLLWIIAIIPAVGVYKMLAALFSSWGSGQNQEPVDQSLSKTQQKKLKKLEKFGHR
jgi:hypothetical protein